MSSRFEGHHEDRFPSGGGQGQSMISAQLLKVGPMMSSLDELFQWFGYAIVQQFDVEIAQFWTPLMNPNGFTSSHLRVMTMRTPSIPEQVLLNDQVILAVKSIEYEQRMIPSRPVEAFFSPRQAALL